MKLKNIILPLSFLSLTPAAKAQSAQETEKDSVNNKKIEILQTPETNASDSTKTALLTEQMKNDLMINEILARLQTPQPSAPDTTKKHTFDETALLTPIQIEEDAEEDVDVITPLVESYNKNPYAHNFDKMMQLLNIIQSPRELYDMLEIPIRHALTLTDEITPQLQEKLGITDKNDILMTSIEKKPEVLTDDEAFNFIADGNILNLIKKPERIIEKSLKIALEDFNSISKNPRKLSCISNIMSYTLKHQDNPEMARLYMEIFIATTNIIRQYDAANDKENINLESINKMSLAIEKFNRDIISGSALDQEIKIKSPRDFVLNEYKDITHRVNLTKIYNEAYYSFLSNRYKTEQQKFKNPAIQRLYSDYIDAIELLTRARKNKITDPQRDALTQLIKKYPEINLLDPYFTNIYINTDKYDNFLNFITAIHANRSEKKQKVPTDILSMLNGCQINANAHRATLEQYSINLPDIQIAKFEKLSYSDALNGPLNPYETFKKIDSTLYQQARALTFQRQALQRLARTGGWGQDPQYIAQLKSR